MSFKVPSHLHRSRHGVLYFRLAVPLDIQMVLGRRELYQSLGTASVRKSVSEAQRLTIAFRRLFDAIRANLAACHHLLVLRIDLGYAQYYCDPALPGEQAISYEEVRRHRIVLIRFLKRRLPKGAYRGYAIKLEFGLDKTYHFHVLVLLNGDVVREGARISRLIGEYWKQYITEGKGGAYNCNATKYKDSGIGSVKYDDAKKRVILETKVAAYLTKPDFYILMTKPDGHRAFWTSHPPKISAKRRGRKRSKAEALPPALPRPVLPDIGRRVDLRAPIRRSR